MKNKGFVTAVVGVAIAVFAGLYFVQRDSQPKQAEPAQVSKVDVPAKSEKSDQALHFVRAHSPQSGNSLARVTVVEWLDPECESCREMHLPVKRLIREYGDRVLFVTRYMPYHKSSLFAASALEEARELGKFEAALDVLFEKQPEWGGHHEPRPDLIPVYLKKLGIPEQNLDRERVIAKHVEKVNQDKADGEAVGVKGTPSFFINEKPLTELGEAELKAAIERELSATEK